MSTDFKRILEFRSGFEFKGNLIEPLRFDSNPWLQSCLEWDYTGLDYGMLELGWRQDQNLSSVYHVRNNGWLYWLIEIAPKGYICTDIMTKPRLGLGL
jgi:hypothetical protein